MQHALIGINKNNLRILDDGKTQNILEEDFQQTQFDRFDNIFVLAEIKWGFKKRQDFYGLELIRILRMGKGFKGRIFVVSFMPFFDISKHPLATILKTPGTFQIQLPVENINIEESPLTIDDELLEDIVLSTYDPVQAIHNYIHDLDNLLAKIIFEWKKNQQNTDKKELISQIQKLLTQKLGSIKNYIKEEKVNDYNMLIDKFVDEIIEVVAVGHFEENSLRKPIDIYKEQLYSYLKVPLQESDKVSSHKKRWGVLYIDDSNADREIVKKYLEKSGINCHLASSAHQAYEILSKNEEEQKNIFIVITDIRLYKNDDIDQGIWQDIQGYQILKHIKHSGDFKFYYGLCVLTSKKGTILDKVKSGTPIHWFHKTEVLSNGDRSFDRFLIQLDKIATNVFSKRHNFPTMPIWTSGSNRVDFGYAYFYKLHMELDDYEDEEGTINKKANAYLNYLLSAGELSDDKKAEYPELEFQPSFSINKYLKEGVQRDTAIKHIVDDFRNSVLLQRRIIAGLFYKLERNDLWKKIFKMMHPRTQVERKNLFYSQGVGIKIKSFKESLLQQEVDFINSLHKSNGFEKPYMLGAKDRDILETYFMSIESIDEIKNADPLIGKVCDAFMNEGNPDKVENWIDSFEKIQNKLQNCDDSLVTSYKEELSFFFKNDFPSLSKHYKELIFKP